MTRWQSWIRIARTRTATGCFRGAWRENNGSKTHSQTRNPRELTGEPMTEDRKNYISKSPIQRYGETPGCSECLGASSRHTTTCRERFERLINPNGTDVIPVIPCAVGDPSPAGDAASTEQRHATQPDTSKHVHQAVGTKGGAEDNPMTSSAKRAHTLPGFAAARRRNGDSTSAGAGARRCDGGQCVV